MPQWPWSRPRGVSDDRGTAGALTAGGERKRLDDRAEAKKLGKNKKPWQETAWCNFDDVGEVKGALRYRADMISKVRLTPAWVERPGTLPVPLDATRDGQPIAPVDDALRALCFDTVSRLDQSDGGLPGLLEKLTYNLDIPGDCWLVGIAERPERPGRNPDKPIPPMPETWMIASLDEIDTKDGYRLLDPPDGLPGGVLTEPEDFLARLWYQHPRKRKLADSPMRGALAICEEILILERTARAWATSRMNAGLVLMSDDFHFGNPDPTVDSDQYGPFKRAYFEMMTAAIGDQEAASAVVPMHVFGPTEAVEKGYRHITYDRALDDKLDQRIENRVKRLARALNAPVERTLGYTDTTFTNSTQIDIDEFRGYLEPSVIAECAMLTSGYYRPMLLAAGVDTAEIGWHVMWFDPSEVVAKPDRIPTATTAHKLGIISDATTRREMGYEESDAPSPEELAERRARQPVLPPVTGDEPADEEEPEAVTAAAPRSGNDLGRRLAEIDRALRDRLEALADRHMRKALEKAGNRIRSKVASVQSYKRVVKDVAPALVASTLGRAVVADVGLTDDELLEAAFEESRPGERSLREEFAIVVQRAQEASLRVVARNVDLEDSERRALEQQQEQDRADAWAWFLAALLALASRRLFDPSPDAEPGEFDSLTTVPPGLVREAVARAGGAKGLESNGGALTTAAGTQPAGGIATGQLLNDVWLSHGWQVTGWEWVYGDPSARENNFEPHLALDGRVITDWGSDELSVGENTWLATTGLRPGDHAGCRCSIAPVYAEGAA